MKKALKDAIEQIEENLTK